MGNGRPNLAGDHGGGRELGWAQASFNHLHKLMSLDLCFSDLCCRQVLKSSQVRLTSMSSLTHPYDLQESQSINGLGSCPEGSQEGGRHMLIHDVLQADPSASFCKLPHKLLWTWFRVMEGGKAVIPQIRE